MMNTKNLPCIKSRDLDDELEEKSPSLPINCSFKCSTCGFNPEVQKWRLENGRWSNEGVALIRFYPGEGEPQYTKVVGGLKTLVIPKVVSLT